MFFMYELELSVYSIVSYQYVLPIFHHFSDILLILHHFCQYFASVVSYMCILINMIYINHLAFNELLIY